ncbi:MAG: hypothetical protein BroJett039_05370 [Chloroflexota bacterium]|nr:MAG: hypothetical protein BroJett039_05370 [Chloroflexota bacterium]
MAGLQKVRTDEFKGYIINDEYFKTKKDVEKRASSILNSYELGQDLNSDDLEFVLALLEYHPDSMKKKGVGVQSIKVIPHEEFGRKNQSFAVVRIDGSETDFSYGKCIRPPKPLQVFKHACRRAVEVQIVAFKKNQFKQYVNSQGLIRCSISNELVDYENCDVDHQAPKTFDWLVETFVREYSISVEAVEIGGFEDGEVTRIFIDQDLASRWKEFHAKNAMLRIVSKLPHRKLPKQKPSSNSQLILF